jgi:hypothetical protein
MYTEQDKARKHAWEQIAVQLSEVADTYMATLANDRSADKPTFESALIQLEGVARAQANLWRNPDTCTCHHSNESHEKLNGPCNHRTSKEHCICYQFRSALEQQKLEREHNIYSL